MLYDGARRFLYQAAVAMRKRRRPDRALKLRRAEAIIKHLRDTLDMDQGEIAARLQAIYLFCNRHLNEARVERDPAKIEEVSTLLGELREAWSDARRGMSSPASAPYEQLIELLEHELAARR